MYTWIQCEKQAMNPKIYEKIIIHKSIEILKSPNSCKYSKTGEI